jgi:hypothetical protein
VSETERNWHPTEVEGLAIIESIPTYHVYLADNPFTVITYNIGVQGLDKAKESKSGRLARWGIQIQQYKNEILHRSGKENKVADALSRRKYPPESAQSVIKELPAPIGSVAPLPVANATQDKVTVEETSDLKGKENLITFFYSTGSTASVAALTTSLDDQADKQQTPKVHSIVTLQNEDPEFQPIIEFLTTERLPEDPILAKSTCLKAQEYVMADQVLYYKFHRRIKGATEDDRFIFQLALPKVCRQDALVSYHDSKAG